MIDLNKIKNSKALKIALAIALPTIIVAGYLGYKYIKKRKDEKNKLINADIDTESKEQNTIDESKIKYYRIRMPYVTDVTNILSNYLKAKEIPHKFISIKTGMDEKSLPVLDYNIGMLPTDLPKLNEAISKLGKGIIKEITKEQTIQNKIENPVCLVRRSKIKSFQEFYESIGCLDYSVLFGYSLIDIKNIPDVENKVTVGELSRIFDFAKLANFNISSEEREELTNILKRIYAEE